MSMQLPGHKSLQVGNWARDLNAGVLASRTSDADLRNKSVEIAPFGSKDLFPTDVLGGTYGALYSPQSGL